MTMARPADGEHAGAKIDHAHLTRLQQRLHGNIILPEDPIYEDARRVWNGMVDKRPAAVVCCATPDDVAETVSLARSQDLPLAVRGGGHNVAGNSVCDGGIVIDLSPMKAVTVDPARCIARAEAGLTLGDFDRATQAHGLATTMGVVSGTGIAGLTLEQFLT
jgi:FAD/FMN-containing dehydrogenase